MIAELDGLDSLVTASILFTNKEYNRSTIQIQGISKEPVARLRWWAGLGNSYLCLWFKSNKLSCVI